MLGVKNSGGEHMSDIHHSSSKFGNISAVKSAVVLFLVLWLSDPRVLCALLVLR